MNQMLSDVNLQGKDVLDAGTGTRSARFLALKGPKKLVCIYVLLGQGI